MEDQEINPACAACKGACCESFVISLPPNPGPDVVRWLGYRGKITNRHIRLDVACNKLNGDGTCSVWNVRPQPCVDYQVGSDACRNAVVARRSTDADTILGIMDEWLQSRKGSSSSGSQEPG